MYGYFGSRILLRPGINYSKIIKTSNLKSAPDQVCIELNEVGC